jgi:hypothetical protein
MDFTKYNQVPTEFATASTIGLAAATLAAMARRGLVEVLPGKPNKYRRIENPAIKIYQLLEENKDDYDEFFVLRKKDVALGMFCWLKSGEVVDCWGNKYDLSNVIALELRTKKFDI